MVNFPFGIAEYLAVTLDPANRAVFSPDTVFPHVGLVSLEGLNKDSLGVIEVLVGNQVTPFDFARIEVFFIVTRKFFNFSIQEIHPPIGISLKYYGRDLVDQQPVFLLTFLSAASAFILSKTVPICIAAFSNSSTNSRGTMFSRRSAT